ncbi:SCO family protein [Alteromonas sp. ASW11-130]|uniref:SCO family protein n=1 Tax=Alteromonas sp. ASW11-130 TaxID=3015775 RepID=UPI002242481A|nr:SCO family protein [Alteromonas sp. ASW11-130]MCW8093327.1 SCO family protein [Alteromonas sp. ASW11-130]
MKQNTIVGIVAFLALIGGVIGAIYIAPPGFKDKPETDYLSTYPAPRALAKVNLTDQRGEPFNLERLKGKWSLLFLGYTFCPDICPTTLASLNRIYPELKQIESEHPIQVVFVSVDPKRDTTTRLKEYTQFFNAEFIAATGNHDQLFPFVRSMGLMYALSESTENPNYLVDHSASVIVVNPQAQVIGRFKPVHQQGMPAITDGQQILQDMSAITAG